MIINFYENQLLQQAQSLLQQSKPFRIEDFRYGDLYLRLANMDQKQNNFRIYHNPKSQIQVYHNLQVLEIVLRQLDISVDTILFFDPYKSQSILFETLSNVITKINITILDKYFSMRKTLLAMNLLMGIENSSQHKIGEIQFLLRQADINNSIQQQNDNSDPQQEQEYDYQEIIKNLTSNQYSIVEDLAKIFQEQQFQFPKETKSIKKNQTKKFQSSNKNFQGCQILGDQLVQFSNLYEGYLEYKNNFFYFYFQQNQKNNSNLSQQTNLFSYKGPQLFSYQQKVSLNNQDEQKVKQLESKLNNIHQSQINQQVQLMQYKQSVQGQIQNTQIPIINTTKPGNVYQAPIITTLPSNIQQPPIITTINNQQIANQSQNNQYTFQLTHGIFQQKFVNKNIESGNYRDLNYSGNFQQSKQNNKDFNKQNQNQNIDDKQPKQKIKSDYKQVIQKQEEQYMDQKLNQFDQQNNQQFINKSKYQTSDVISEEIIFQKKRIQPSKMIDIFNIVGQKVENLTDGNNDQIQDNTQNQSIQSVQNIGQIQNNSVFESKDFGEFNLFSSFGLDEQNQNINETSQIVQSINKKENIKLTNGQIQDNQHLIFQEKFNKTKFKDKTRCQINNGQKNFQVTPSLRITEQSFNNINFKPSEQCDGSQIQSQDMNKKPIE